MAKSSLLGIEPVNPVAPGHDDLALGPSDSSDSGSDVAGLESLDLDDPQAPVDQALADDAGREAGDISVDRVFNPFSDGDENDDPDAPDAPLPGDVDAAAVDAPVDDTDEADDTLIGTGTDDTDDTDAHRDHRPGRDRGR